MSSILLWCQLCMLLFIGCISAVVNAKGFDQFGERIDDEKRKQLHVVVVVVFCYYFFFLPYQIRYSVRMCVCVRVWRDDQWSFDHVYLNRKIYFVAFCVHSQYMWLLIIICYYNDFYYNCRIFNSLNISTFPNKSILIDATEPGELSDVVFCLLLWHLKRSYDAVQFNINNLSKQYFFFHLSISFSVTHTHRCHVL